MSTDASSRKRKRNHEISGQTEDDESVHKKKQRRGRRRRKPEEQTDEANTTGQEQNGLNVGNGATPRILSSSSLAAPTGSSQQAESDDQRNDVALQAQPKAEKRRRRRRRKGHEGSPEAAAVEAVGRGRLQDGTNEVGTRDVETRLPRKNEQISGKPSQDDVTSIIRPTWSVSQATGGRLLDTDPIFSSDEKYVPCHRDGPNILGDRLL